MVVRCPDCGARYEVSTEGMDVATLKVRCPRCKAVFPVRPVDPEVVLSSFRTSPGVGDSAGKPKQKAQKLGMKPAPMEPVSENARPKTRENPRITDPQVARRLARAMVSEIVLNRQADRKEALGEATLLSRFGPAILAAYRVYSKKVSPRLPGSRRIFREAVNEILGDSHPVL